MVARRHQNDRIAPPGTQEGWNQRHGRLDQRRECGILRRAADLNAGGGKHRAGDHPAEVRHAIGSLADEDVDVAGRGLAGKEQANLREPSVLRIEEGLSNLLAIEGGRALDGIPVGFFIGIEPELCDPDELVVDRRIGPVGGGHLPRLAIDAEDAGDGVIAPLPPPGGIGADGLR